MDERLQPRCPFLDARVPRLRRTWAFLFSAHHFPLRIDVKSAITSSPLHWSLTQLIICLFLLCGFVDMGDSVFVDRRIAYLVSISQFLSMNSRVPCCSQRSNRVKCSEQLCSISFCITLISAADVNIHPWILLKPEYLCLNVHFGSWIVEVARLSSAMVLHQRVSCEEIMWGF